jgi:dihydrofolate reductase
MRVVVINHLTLDGVMQAPGAPDEDTRGEFSHGGWATARSDEALGQGMGAAMGENPTYLFGRRTYESLLESWNRQGGPFKEALNSTPKYVVSHSEATTLPWDNSTLVAGEAIETVAALREEPGGNLVVMGSGELVRALLPHGLVDELLLMIHPVVLGSGQRLFGVSERPLELEPTGSTLTPAGVLAVTYRRDRA